VIVFKHLHESSWLLVSKVVKNPCKICTRLLLRATQPPVPSFATKDPLFDLPEGPFFPYAEDNEQREQNTMTIHLTPEQDRRIQAVISRGAYESVEEVVGAALTAVEQRTVPGFVGTQEELDTLLAEGLASKQLAEDEFWGSVSKQTDAMLAEHKTGPRS